MRELKNGTVVAQVVASLEKQGQIPSRLSKPLHLQRFNKERKSRGVENGTGAKYTCLDDDNFKSAVEAFDSVAEDVESIVAANKRPGNSAGSLQSDFPQERDGLSDDLSCDSSDSDSSDSASEREHVIEGLGLETITEEERSVSSVHSFRGLEENESSLEEDSTLKGPNPGWSGSSNNGSTSDLSTTSSEKPRSLRDSSTRCNSDFQWIRKEAQKPSDKMTSKMEHHESIPISKPPINRSTRDRTPKRPSAEREKCSPGSLDRRRHRSDRQERDQKSRSSHILKSPPRLEDFTQGCCAHENFCFENFHRRHERLDPQRYGSSPMLMEHRRYGSERGSHPDIYSDSGSGRFNGDFEGRYRHDMGCCSYHMGPPPCCMGYFGGDRRYHWNPPPYPKPGEQDERFRKMQYERDNLQLQVQVLTEQIEAQSDKITDLEKTLLEKKQHLSEAEEKLQREVLSRSALETQKLELMSIMSELKLQQAALERENMELRSCQYNNNSDVKKPPLMPRMSPQPQLISSTPVQQGGSQGVNMRMSPSPSPVTVSSSRRSDSHPESSPKTPPAMYKRQIDVHYGSLPRQQFLSNGGISAISSGTDNNANPNFANGGSRSKGVAFGRGFASFMQGRHRGFSVPNLAEAEKIIGEDSPGSPTLSINKSKGIKKIFGKMKRSGSGNLEDLPGAEEFQRGGIRATASARLGWSEPQIMPKPDKPFAEWDTENICDWLQDLGLDQYITEAKRWVKSGEQLQEASINEIEKELAIKNPLHKKKLQLALIDMQANGSSDVYLKQAGKLDTSWVLRWLDDTGLPQHKEAFLINRVDGRVLHRLTVDDLSLLHVTSLLHVASIKRGIQVLRENNFEPACLQRRSLPDDPPQPTPKQISLWTTHRVMEWLRAVDLAEYAPNLRGAGVHGGLMVLETKFTAELLASLLSIPPGKTLLRRHLNTHFKELLGKEIIQEKREAEAVMGYIPLTPSSKLKVSKKSQFSLKRKKSKGEADYGDLVCPMNPDKSDDEDGKSRGRGCLSSR